MRKKKPKYFQNKKLRILIVCISVLAVVSFLPKRIMYRIGLAPRIFLAGLLGHECEKNKMMNYPFTVDPVYGIDVSVHQGKINWDKVSSYDDKPISFVYIKASEGATKKDKCYEYNLKEARDNGILVGSYHYFKANRSAESQVANFTKLADKDKQDLVPLVDVEEMNGATRLEFYERLTQFLKLVEEHYGRKPVLYSQNHFFNCNLADKFDQYPLMIARYHIQKPAIRENIDWTIWQFTEKGKVKGIDGFVDVNILNNVAFDLDELKM